jgi:hypothetical protein
MRQDQGRPRPRWLRPALVAFDRIPQESVDRCGALPFEGNANDLSEETPLKTFQKTERGVRLT